VGTGTNDVIDRCVELGLRKPEFRQDEDFMVTLWRKEGAGTVQSNPESLPNSKESARSWQGVRRGLSCT
jgi:predicted HTH transcriptional regulator